MSFPAPSLENFHRTRGQPETLSPAGTSVLSSALGGPAVGTAVLSRETALLLLVFTRDDGGRHSLSSVSIFSSCEKQELFSQLFLCDSEARH